MLDNTETRTFPEFSLSRLLKTVFEPKPGQRIGILIDLADPKQIDGIRLSEGRRADHSATRPRRVLPRPEERGPGGAGSSRRGDVRLPDHRRQQPGPARRRLDSRGTPGQPGERRLSQLRHSPLHLDVFGHRAAHGVREAVRISRGDAARSQPHHPAHGAGGGLQRGQPTGREAAPGDDPRRRVRDRLRGGRPESHLEAAVRPTGGAEEPRIVPG